MPSATTPIRSGMRLRNGLPESFASGAFCSALLDSTGCEGDGLAEGGGAWKIGGGGEAVLVEVELTSIDPVIGVPPYSLAGSGNFGMVP